MAKCEFRVTGISVEPNVRGQDMRRVHLTALPSSEALASLEKLQEGVEPAGPDGHISILVNPRFAKDLALGQEAHLVFQARKKR